MELFTPKDVYFGQDTWEAGSKKKFIAVIQTQQTRYVNTNILSTTKSKKYLSS